MSYSWQQATQKPQGNVQYSYGHTVGPRPGAQPQYQNQQYQGQQYQGYQGRGMSRGMSFFGGNTQSSVGQQQRANRVGGTIFDGLFQNIDRQFKNMQRPNQQQQRYSMPNHPNHPQPTHQAPNRPQQQRVEDPTANPLFMALSRMPREEIKLAAGARDRRRYDELADLFAIIKTIENLETAYVRDIISAKEYSALCTKLLAQFKTIRGALKDSIHDVQQFMRDFKMDCPAAIARFTAGVPATTEHAASSGDTAKQTMHVAETVQYFITAMDSVKLGLVAVDQVHPLLNDLLQSLNNITQLGQDSPARSKVTTWLEKLAKLGATDELSEDDTRQLLFDLESSYNEFQRFLHQDA